MKKIAVLISLILCLFFAMPGQAEAPINVIINGTKLNTDVSPTIIDGRTMVPIAAIAQGLGCEASWDANLQQVTITSKAVTPISKDISVEGPDDIRQFIAEVFDKMDSASKTFTSTYLTKIVYEDPPRFHKAYAWSNVGSNGICYIDSIFYEQAKAKLSHEEMIYGYIGYLVHEANHFCLRKSGAEYMYSDQDQEALCDIAACKAIEKAGGKNSAYYGQFKKSLQRELNY